MDLQTIDKEFMAETSDGGQKITIPKDEVNNDRTLFDVHYSDGVCAASVIWVGGEVKQPAIITINKDTKYLAFEGQANFVGGFQTLIMPNDGDLYEIKQNTRYFFKNTFPETPEGAYSLQFNNKSIRMNNISVINTDCSKEVMFDFRASMEGTFSDETKNGYVVVLAAIDPIN